MASRRTLDNLMLLMIPEIRDIFLEVMGNISDEVILAQLTEAIESNDPEAAFKAIGFTPAALSPLLDAIERVYKDAGAVNVEENFPARIRTPLGSVIFRFDARNPRAEQQIREHSSQLVSRLTNEARDNVKITLERGLIAGNNPRTTALDIVGRVDPVTKKRVGGIIGLNAQQEYWVSNGRRYLEQLDKRYLTMTLRDKRFDRTVEKAIESGKPLNKETIDKLMTAYKNSALKYRADTVARTETIQGINRGEFQSYMQAIEEGTIQRRAIKKHWDSTGDLRTRWTHSALERKYKLKGLEIEDPYVSPSGSRMLFPGDVSLGATGSEIVNCRCKQKIVVDWILNAGLE